jgi:hypothetical protein
MALERKSLRLGLLATALFLAVAGPIRADKVTVAVGGADAGGYFPYTLTVLDQNCCLDVVGVIVTKGFSVFDLDFTSTIGQPAGWFNIPPIPGALDNLTWFDFDPAAAIVPNMPQGGFTFSSQTAPTSLAAGKFDIQLIYSDSSTADIGDAVVLPEPSSIVLAGLLMVLLFVRKYVASPQRR